MTIMVTAAHVRKCNLCMRGAREWTVRHGINYREFIMCGIAVERVEEVGDHFALMVCRVAREEYEAKNG